MHRASFVLLLSLVVAVLPVVRPAHLAAQQPSGAPGDFYWQFANQGIMADPRVQGAFVLLLDADAVIAGAGVEGDLLYGDTGVTEFTSQVGPEEASLLLAAAGFADPAKDLLRTRPCRLWTPHVTEGDEERIAVAHALGHQIARVLIGLGVDAGACELVPDSGDADVFVWQFGQNLELPEGDPGFGADSFLVPNVELPGRVPGGTGGDVSPPVVGSGGLLPAHAQE